MTINRFLQTASFLFILFATISISKENNKPIFVDADTGQTWNIFGLKIVGKIFSEQTDGQYSVITQQYSSKQWPAKNTFTKMKMKCFMC